MVLRSDKLVKPDGILIENGKIISFDAVDKSDKVIDATDDIIAPGLVNMHTHSPMCLFRGFSDNKRLDKWLQEDIWPLEQMIKPDEIYYGSLLAFMEMISTGTTCFNDMYFHVDKIAQAADKIGIRGFLGHGMIDLGEAKKREKELKRTKKVINIINDKHSELLKPTVAPHSLETCSDELYKRAKELAEKNNLFLHTHLAETEEDTSQAIKLNSMDIIDNRFIGAHGVHLTEKEMQILSQKKATIVHNPCSNMKLSSGIAALHSMEEKGINLCLGTDGAASNNNLNMFEEMKFASLLQKIYNKDPTKSTARQTYRMATNNASGLCNNRIGKIEKGAYADLIFLDRKEIQMIPLYNIYSNMVYSSTSPDKVMINGNIVYAENKFNSVDKEEIIKKIDAISTRFVEKMN